MKVLKTSCLLHFSGLRSRPFTHLLSECTFQWRQTPQVIPVKGSLVRHALKGFSFPQALEIFCQSEETIMNQMLNGLTLYEAYLSPVTNAQSSNPRQTCEQFPGTHDRPRKERCCPKYIYKHLFRPVLAILFNTTDSPRELDRNSGQSDRLRHVMMGFRFLTQLWSPPGDITISQPNLPSQSCCCGD